MHIYGYARVSTDEQAESGAGLDAQRDALEGWARRQGHDLAGLFVDEGLSGARSLEDRPALLEAVSQLAAGDVLLVSKRDRLGRDPIVSAMIEAAAARQGARVVSAAGEGTEGDDPSNILMRRIVDAFAEYERLVIKARTKSALAAKSRRGERVGQVPYGATLAGDGRTLLPDPAGLEIVALAHRLRSQGLSLRKIAYELTARGHAPKNGGAAFSHTSVVELLKRRDPAREQRTAEDTPDRDAA